LFLRSVAEDSFWSKFQKFGTKDLNKL